MTVFKHPTEHSTQGTCAIGSHTRLSNGYAMIISEVE